jgi:hypothetical protein
VTWSTIAQSIHDYDSAAFAFVNNAFVLSGGVSSSTYGRTVTSSSDGGLHCFTDTVLIPSSRFSIVSWVRVCSSAPWSPRAHHSMLVHAGNLYIIGGMYSALSTEVYSRDIWMSSDTGSNYLVYIFELSLTLSFQTLGERWMTQQGTEGGQACAR